MSVFAGLVVPVALHANATGPDPGLAGVPGELGTCALPRNGQRKCEQGEGFQATARPASSTSTMAGAFHSTDTLTQVICSNSHFFGAPRTTGACPATAPLMYVEQTTAGTRLGTTGSVTFNYDWTPPATDVGPITVYIAANAANGNNRDDTGDHVYSASFTLTPATANGPAITGVVNGASFASASRRGRG